MSKKGTKVKKNKRSHKFLTKKCSKVLNKRSNKNNFYAKYFLFWIKNQVASNILGKSAKFPNKFQ